MSKELVFPCTKCGHCCRNIGTTVKAARNNKIPSKKLQALLVKFPYKWKYDKSCSQLAADGTCNVYDKRPVVCNIEELQKVFAEDFTKEKFFLDNMAGCNVLIDRYGTGEKQDIEKFKKENRII